MANWLPGNIGNSLDAIRNRVNESLAEVLAEEDPEEPAVQLAVLRERLERQRAEIERLEEDKAAAEIQKEVQCQQFRDMVARDGYRQIFR